MQMCCVWWLGYSSTHNLDKIRALQDFRTVSLLVQIYWWNSMKVYNNMFTLRCMYCATCGVPALHGSLCFFCTAEYLHGTLPTYSSVQQLFQQHSSLADCILIRSCCKMSLRKDNPLWALWRSYTSSHVESCAEARTTVITWYNIVNSASFGGDSIVQFWWQFSTVFYPCIYRPITRQEIATRRGERAKSVYPIITETRQGEQDKS